MGHPLAWVIDSVGGRFVAEVRLGFGPPLPVVTSMASSKSRLFWASVPSETSGDAELYCGSSISVELVNNLVLEGNYFRIHTVE